MTAEEFENRWGIRLQMPSLREGRLLVRSVPWNEEWLDRVHRVVTEIVPRGFRKAWLPTHLVVADGIYWMGARNWGGAYPVGRQTGATRLVLLDRATFQGVLADPAGPPAAEAVLLHEMAHHADALLQDDVRSAQETAWLELTAQDSRQLAERNPYHRTIDTLEDQAVEDWANALALYLLEPAQLQVWSQERYNFMEELCRSVEP
ncbi:MAG: hypothetical protein FJX77_06720 [Armatimonadetes bacterium]|nr:hypothetical protein [Armatimonadota bacterium]